MTDQTNSVTFNSLDEIDDTVLESSTTPETVVTTEEAVKEEVKVVSEEENVLSINSNTEASPPVVAAKVNDAPVVTAVKVEEVKAVEASTAKKREIPELEAEIATNAEEDKKSGKTEEIFNTINTALEKLTSSADVMSASNARIAESLDNIKFDPNNIEVSDNINDDPLAVFNQLEILKAVLPNPVFPVIALKSGYKADIGALNNNDKIELRNLTGSNTDQTMKLLKIIFSKIASTSIGKINFQKFLDITAEDDYETLVYGLFSASFPNATEYNMGCPHCGTEVKLPLYPSQLIEVIDREKAGAYVATVLENYNKGVEFLRNSLVNKHTRVSLPKSRAVVEVITPTLKNMLDSTRFIDKNKGQYSADLINTAKYIRTIYVLNIEHLQATGKPVFFPISDQNEILSFIADSHAEDLKVIRKSVSTTVRNYSIQYRIPKFTCPSSECLKDIDKVHVDLTKLLFFGIVGELAA